MTSLWHRFRRSPLWVQLAAATLLVVASAATSAGLPGADPEAGPGSAIGTTTSMADTGPSTASSGRPDDGTGTGRAGPSTTGPGGTAPSRPAVPATTATTIEPLAATTTTTRLAAPSGDPAAALSGLRVELERPRTGYQRDLFVHWVDSDGDGCNTREEVLIAESRTAAQVDPYGCKVIEGDWYSSYDGLAFTDPSELDVDHMVPLAEAWDSGASGWNAGRRRAFANDLDRPEALRAVSASSNRSKGDLDPGQWKPTRDAAWCEYANDWVAVKKAWDLTADQNEVDDLRVMLRTCGDQSPKAAPPPPVATPTTTTTTTAPTSPPGAGGAVVISALDCRGETVTVRNGGAAPADLAGWSIHDRGARHTYRFPAGFALAAGASVAIRSGGPAGPGELPWTGRNVWNNDGDTAYLVDAGGGVVSTRSC